MAVYHPEFVFLANPLTASRAIAKALLTLPETREIHPHHARLPQVMQYVPEFQGGPVFESVRHPLDWLVSRHMRGPDRGVNFNTWLRRQKSPIFFKHRASADSFVRFESIEADILDVTGYEVTLEFDDDHMTHGRARANYAAQYTPDDIEWVRRTFAEDLERFGYEI